MLEEAYGKQIKDILHEVYVVKGHSGPEISAAFGVSKPTIYHWMRYFGFKRRSQRASKILHMKSPLARRKVSRGVKALYDADPTYCERVSKGTKKAMEPHSVRVKISRAQRKAWADPAYKDAHLRRVRNAANQAPNKAELRLLAILRELFDEHEWAYCGNGEVLLGGLNPDFINTNGKKLIIELFGEPFHTNRLHPIRFNQTEAGRRKVYSRYGYQMLVVWFEELKNTEMVKAKVVDFAGGESR